ncbi:PD-(D/E)XK nuclease family protein [Paenibacillus foliorum]|nr:PD-(D/E)XK nuclease family protein [Paenibacillus foliorum]
MNIFKILASNDGSINEPNVSSFLAYLLDPNENHGLDSVFLEYFLTPVILGNKDSFKELIYNDRIRNLSKRSPYSISVQAEMTVMLDTETSKQKTRDIDILIEIFHSSDPHRARFAFCIENKIKDGAIQKGGNQLYEELTGLIQYYASRSAADGRGVSSAQIPALSFIFLTPKRNIRAVEEFAELVDKLEFTDSIKNIPCYHMTWGPDAAQTQEEAPAHVVAMLNRTLQDEACGNIEPIYDYTKHTLKSFLTFIKSDFHSYKEEKTAGTERRSYGKTIPEFYYDVFTELEFDRDYASNDIKNRVKELVLRSSGNEVRKPTLDATLIFTTVNNSNRKHQGVTDPQKHEINLFYCPDENNKKMIRKLSQNDPPADIYIYWKDNSSDDKTGKCLLTEIYPSLR